MDTRIIDIYTKCVNAIKKGILISRESKKDKEFHFQNWFKDRLEETELNFEMGGRNSYPDFRLVATTEGYEIKGLAYPGRETSYDCNSQAPSGLHNGRTIYYVFGRYPAEPDGETYPVLDLVICHGDFLNANHEYIHKNKSIKGFGSYGDIMIRDRKMYVAPTPFGLTEGTAHQQTLILPEGLKVGNNFKKVGTLIRKEAENLIIGYHFDFRGNKLTAKTIPNPSAGREHNFTAWRLNEASNEKVTLRKAPSLNDGACQEEEDEA